jgi:ADP-ribose pyrophosphatase YjhB (NUDIX family)
MPNVVPTIGVLVFRNNCKEVLLVKHGEKAGHPTGIYGFSSGRIESLESEKAACVRELREESGLKTLEANLVEIPYDFGITKLKRKVGIMICTWKVFICNKYSGEIKTDGRETIPEWVNVSKLDKYWLLPSIKKAIYEGKKYLNCK